MSYESKIISSKALHSSTILIYKTNLVHGWWANSTPMGSNSTTKETWIIFLSSRCTAICSITSCWLAFNLLLAMLSNTLSTYTITLKNCQDHKINGRARQSEHWLNPTSFHMANRFSFAKYSSAHNKLTYAGGVPQKILSIKSHPHLSFGSMENLYGLLY